MKQQIIIEWHAESEDGEVKASHQEALVESVMARIQHMLGEGYHSGELVESIRMNGSDGDDGVAYYGWWSTKKETTVNERFVML